MSRYARWLLVAGLAASSPLLRAEASSSLLARLRAAEAESSLDDTGIKPWHLKVSFQMFNEHENPTEQGTMEEWWSGTKQYKISFVSPSYTSTELHNQDGAFRTKGTLPLPYALKALQRGIVHPVPDAELADAKPDLRQETVSNIKMDCIMMDAPIKDNPTVPLGLFPTFCLEGGANTLRMSYGEGTLQIVRARIGAFQQRKVAVDLLVGDSGKKLLSGHIDALTTGMTGATFDATPDMEKSAPDAAVRVASGLAAGRKLSGTLPIYPVQARENHVSGAVIMRAIIGTDGHISQLQVVSTTSGDLAIAALEAVRTWVYKPYLLNGVPVAVETTITVNFNFG